MASSLEAARFTFILDTIDGENHASPQSALVSDLYASFSSSSLAY